MQQLAKIPLFVVEEHNEAFYFWNYAIRNGMIPDAGNTLLHIDEHSDMSSARFKSCIHDLNGNLDNIKKFTRTELTIDSFISAAIYRNIFNKVQWVKQFHDGNSINLDIEMYVRSYNNLGKKLIIGRISDMQLHDRIKGEINIRYFNYCRKHVDQIGNEARMVLDIDLDFFSCTGHPYRQKELLIEISADEFHRFSTDSYHRLNYLFSRVELASCDGKYYYLINNYDEIYPEKTYVSEDLISTRISQLISVLQQERIVPLIITICRSRFSGFTHDDQWQFIENELLGKLNELYAIDLIPSGRL